jgi:hypothetical protein
MMEEEGDKAGGSFLNSSQIGELDRIAGVGGLEGIGDLDLGE